MGTNNKAYSEIKPKSLKLCKAKQKMLFLKYLRRKTFRITWKSSPQQFELLVVWPEVVTPLRNAVGFIDDEPAQLLALVEALEKGFEAEQENIKTVSYNSSKVYWLNEYPEIVFEIVNVYYIVQRNRVSPENESI